MALHLIMGPMYAGKTSELMRELERYDYCTNYSVLRVSHVWDTQRTDGQPIVRSHSARSAPAVMVSELADVLKLPAYVEAKVVGIDEGQFFEDLVPTVRRMVDVDHKIVFVAGLDGSFEREPLGHLLKLIPLCDTVKKLSAVCQQCEELSDAIFTRSLVAQHGSFNVGGTDKYRAVCRKHYLHPAGSASQ